MTKLFILLAALLASPGNGKNPVVASANVKQPAVTATSETTGVTAAEIADAMTKRWKPSWGRQEKFPGYARLFVKYGRRWKVDPVLVAAVAYTESRYRENPKLFRMKCTFSVPTCSKPGPCYRFNWKWKKTCKKVLVNQAEAGMMQVLYYDRSTHEGYKKCTGKRLRGRKEKKKRLLRPVNVAVCVGTYELAKWKTWATVGGYGKVRKRWRMRPKFKRDVAFYRQYPRLKKFFWVTWYNAGSNVFKNNGYSRKVLWMFMQYNKEIQQRRKE